MRTPVCVSAILTTEQSVLPKELPVAVIMWAFVTRKFRRGFDLSSEEGLLGTVHNGVP